MKNKLNIMWAAVLFAFASAFAVLAFDKPTTTHADLTTVEDETGTKTTYDLQGHVISGIDAFAASNQQKIFALDTMSAASTTYISVPWNMASPYQYQYFFKMRKIAGTPNVKIRLEERNIAQSSIWSAIDSVSVSGADSLKLHFRLRGTNVYGAFHRIAFVKTGTNTMARNVELNVKGTN